MSRESLRFAVGDHPVLEVSAHSGDLWIEVAAPGAIEAELDTGERGYDVHHAGSRVTITPRPGRFRRFGGGDLNLTVPAGTDLIARTASGDIRIAQESPRGAALGRVEITTAAGDVRLGSVTADLTVKTASGDCHADAVGGSLTAATASGDIRIGSVAGDAEVATASGDVWIDRVDGTVGFRTASGDVNVLELAGPSVRGKSLSGDVRLGIPPRREIQLEFSSLAGDLRHDLTASGLEPEAHLRIDVSGVSGDLFLHDA